VFINQKMLDILQSPDGGALTFQTDKVVSSTGETWPIVDGVIDFLKTGSEQRLPVLSHAISKMAKDLIASTDGLVLNLSAGGSMEKSPNVIELEWGLYRNTDVAADAHSLPFKDNVFDGVVCLNSFEHYHDPLKVASEVQRVLKPSGFVYVLTAFMQPEHMTPHHYYNATTHGVRKWFEAFEVERCGATEYHNVMLALQWLSAHALWALNPHGNHPEFSELTLGELASAWQGNGNEATKAAHAAAAKLPQGLRDKGAQAIELLARKPAVQVIKGARKA
jgi:SAM-dependent methyltransferase